MNKVNPPIGITPFLLDLTFLKCVSKAIGVMVKLLGSGVRLPG